MTFKEKSYTDMFKIYEKTTTVYSSVLLSAFVLCTVKQFLCNLLGFLLITGE